MDDAVQEGTEQTVPETSQVSEDQSTNDELESEDSSSSEDVNTQSEDDGEELVDQAKNEVKSDRGQNRVQELANQNRSLRQELEEIQRKQSEQYQYQQGYGQQPTRDDYLAAQVASQGVQLQRTQEEMLWREAVSRVPELDQENDGYSPDFENLVYSNYLVRRNKGEDISPVQVAREVKAQVESFAKKEASKREQSKEVKRSVAPTGDQRTPSLEETSAQRSQQDKFKQSGNWQDLVDLM